ncbi:MAG: hypothetical protein AAF624_17875 [Bacteroidota bacterium]
MPLDEGETGMGVLISADLDTGALRDMSIWVAHGFGNDVDFAWSIDAMMAAVNLMAIPIMGGEVPTGPPGLFLRKSFDNGLGIGLATSSRSATFCSGGCFAYPSSGPTLMIGPFITYAPVTDAPFAARLTTYVGYAVVSHPTSSTEATSRRGMAMQAEGQLGPAFRTDSTAAIPGVRATVGYWLWPRRVRMQGTSIGGTFFYLGPNESSDDD